MNACVGKEVKKETKLGLSEKKNEESFGNWYQEVMSVIFFKVSGRLAWILEEVCSRRHDRFCF